MNVNNVVLKESELIRRYVDERQIPGACFSIVTPKEIAYSSYGNKALVPEEEVTSTDTLYDIASLSKVVSTSTMIAKLIVHGKDRQERIGNNEKYIHSSLYLRKLANFTIASSLVLSATSM